MRTTSPLLRATSVTMVSVFILLAVGPLNVVAQSSTASDSRASQLTSIGRGGLAGQTDADHSYFRQMYRDFYNTYQLGPEDQIGVRLQGQPDYSSEQLTVSPVGRIYHPLLGEIEVAGLTVPKLTEKLTLELSQYIIEPKVSVSLVTANSAKVGVLGDVTRPGILVMSKPMTILDAISASGGISDMGSSSDVTVLRQVGGGLQTKKVNVKRILQGKAGLEENLSLQAGDTVIVHGNTRKKLAMFTSMMGFGNFLWFLQRF